MNHERYSIQDIDLDQLLCKSQWVTTFPAGRRCAHFGCDTILSVYNSEDYCAAHREYVPDAAFDAEYRTCPHCNRTLPLDEFGVDEWRRNGRSSTCKDCIRERKRLHYQANRERERKRKNEWYARTKAKVVFPNRVTEMELT